MRVPYSGSRVLLVAVLAATGCAGTSRTQVATDATTTTASTAPTTTTPPDCAATLPTGAQASQLLMVMVEDPNSAAEPIRQGIIGGFGLKGNQRSDIAEILAEVTAEVPLPATVAVDEEGGTVQRLRYSAGRLASARDLAEGSPSEAAAVVGEHAERMAELGVTMNFAPVADVGDNQVLGSRTFGDDPALVGQFAAAVARANSDAGVTPVVKHWPGIGGTEVDPHETLPVLAPVDELRASDMAAFEPAISGGVPAVMVAHAEVPGLTAQGEPASLSRPAITEELRGRQGFEGVVITDSLGMGAVVNKMTQADAAETAISAGADIALLSGTDVVSDAHDQLTAAIDEGRIPEEQVEASVRRVLAMKGIEGECLDAVSAFGALGRLESENSANSSEDDGSSGDDSSSEDDSSTEDDGSTATTGDVVDNGINEP